MMHLTLHTSVEDTEGNPVYLKDIWPSQEEIEEAEKLIRSETYEKVYREPLIRAYFQHRVGVPDADRVPELFFDITAHFHVD